MNIIIDTHALFWFITSDKKLSEKARITIRGAITLYIPSIVLLELLYLMKKQKLGKQFPSLLSKIKNRKKYVVISLDLGLIDMLAGADFPLEIHDSIIVATAKMLKLPVITKDREIKKVYTQTIW